MIDMAKKRSRPTKRKLLSFEFKGRPRRALLWKKATYEMWFIYARVHQRNGGMIPKAFGDLSKFESFEEWWSHPKYGFELFCEPKHRDLVEVVDGRAKQESGTALLKVRLNADRELILRDFATLMKKMTEHEEYRSEARFQPSLPQQMIKLKKLEEALSAYMLSERMVHRRAIHRLYKKGAGERRKLEKVDCFRRIDTGERVHVDGKYTRVYRNERYRRRQWVPNRAYDKWVQKKTRILIRQRRVVKDAFKSIESGTFP